eukprot:g4406.t1
MSLLLVLGVGVLLLLNEGAGILIAEAHQDKRAVARGRRVETTRAGVDMKETQVSLTSPSVVAEAMGLAAFPSLPVISSAASDDINRGAAVSTFEDAFVADRISRQTKESASETFRFREEKKTHQSARKEKKQVSAVDCCKLCPEMFQGLDVIPTMSFAEIKESVSARAISIPAAHKITPWKDTFASMSNPFGRGRKERDATSSRQIEERRGWDSARFEAAHHSTTRRDRANGGGKPKKGELPPPKPVPLSIEQLIDMTPCCPVCLEQFRPPVDVDDAAFVEVEENVRLRTGTGFVFGRSKKGDVKPSCCTMCPNDELPSMGTFEVGGKKPSSFLELGTTFLGKLFGGGKKKEAEDKRIRPDGCCNQCPASTFEGADVRFQEPQGGPFGMLPRMRSVSGSFPLVQPPKTTTRK